MSDDQVEANKRIVANFFAAQSDPSIGDPYKDCSENFVYWIAGEKSHSPSAIAGRWQGEQLYALKARLGDFIAGGSADIKHITAEDDRVAVEAEYSLTLKNGKAYNNAIHFLFFVRDGKIEEVKEYLDTVLVNETFGLAADHGARLV